MNTDALTLRFAEWLKAKFFPHVFAGKNLQGFVGGAFSSLIAASVMGKVAPFITPDLKIDAASLKKMADDGFQVTDGIPFEISPNIIPENFRFLAPLLFDMSLPDPSIKVTFRRDDVYSIIDFLFPSAQVSQVIL